MGTDTALGMFLLQEVWTVCMGLPRWPQSACFWGFGGDLREEELPRVVSYVSVQRAKSSLKAEPRDSLQSEKWTENKLPCILPDGNPWRGEDQAGCLCF